MTGEDGIASHGHLATAKNNWNSICWNYSVPGPVISIGQTENLINKNVHQYSGNSLLTLAQGPMEMQREGPPLQDVECQVRYPGRNDLKSSMAFLLLKFNFVFQAEEMFSAEVWLAGWSVGSIGKHLNTVYLKVRVYTLSATPELLFLRFGPL